MKTTPTIDELLVAYTKDPEQQHLVARVRVENSVAAIFRDVPDLKLMRMRGYTPSFNDGDPCTHHQEVAVDTYDGGDIFYDYFSNTHSMTQEEQVESDPRLALLSSNERFEWSHRLYDSNTRTSIDVAFPTDPFQAGVIKASRLLYALVDEFEILYDTNWELDIIRDEAAVNGYRMELSEHDPGY